MRQVNGDGVIHTTRAVMNDMRRQKYGRIVNITSIAALGTSLPGNAFYAATKAEAQILTLRFALELGSFGITVNAVAPGYIQTEMTRGVDEEAWKERAQKIGALAMLGRVGDPEDIANAAAFFASPELGWVTGQGWRSTAAAWIIWGGSGSLRAGNSRD